MASRATAPWAGASPASSLSPAASSNRWIFFAVVIVLAVLLGGGAVALLYQFANPTPTNDRKQGATPTPETRPTPGRDKVTPRVDPTPAATTDLSGEWNLVNTIESTSYPAYANLRVGYHLVIHQNGNEFTADGEKVSENGAPMADSERTPIQLTGSIDQQTVTATFVEAGLRRQTSGRFVWTISANSKQLRGTFVSTAAKSSGSSVGVREQ
jgi:hypothetical protein